MKRKNRIKKIKIRRNKIDISKIVANRFYNAYGFDANTDRAYSQLSKIKIPKR